MNGAPLPGLCRGLRIALALLAFNLSPAAAQTALGGGARPEVGNAEAGAQLAAYGNPSRQLPACSVCHGRQGQGSGTAGFPRLAGQPAAYLEHQLIAFTGRERPSSVMSPIAAKLDAQQRKDLAAFFSKSDPLALPAPPPSSGRGRTLAMHGDEAKGIPACSSCHGWNGAGNPPGVPYLAGQHADYLEHSLRHWANGNRDTDHRRQMPEIARRLTPEDVRAVAEYFSQLPPPNASNANRDGLDAHDR